MPNTMDTQRKKQSYRTIEINPQKQFEMTMLQ